MQLWTHTHTHVGLVWTVGTAFFRARADVDDNGEWRFLSTSDAGADADPNERDMRFSSCSDAVVIPNPNDGDVRFSSTWDVGTLSEIYRARAGRLFQTFRNRSGN